MDPTQRAQLVDRIVTTWPHGPKGMIWTETLADHPEIGFGEALDVYKHLRDSIERNPPTVAVFLATWRARHHRPEPVAQRSADDGPTMSFTEYITRLTVKAAAGDTEAAHILDVWEQNMARTPQGWTP
jgi:hypothetical protein